MDRKALNERIEEYRGPVNRAGMPNAFRLGAMTLNEVRALEDLPPINGRDFIDVGKVFEMRLRFCSAHRVPRLLSADARGVLWILALMCGGMALVGLGVKLTLALIGGM